VTQPADPPAVDVPTMAELADPTPNAWLIDPPFVLYKFLGNELAVAGLTKTGVMLAEMAPWLFKAATKGVPKNNPKAMLALGRLIKQSREQSPFAAEEMSTGFKTICGHSAIAIWAGIETAIEQMLVNHIQKLPDIKELMALVAPALKLEKVQTTTEADARRSVRKWEAALDDPDALVRAIKMLGAVGLEIELPEKDHRLLVEISEVRNVLLHRGGVIDRGFIAKCPWLGVKTGDELVIDEARLEEFTDAAQAFAAAFSKAVVNSPYLFRKPAAT
jgi:hypothetical protein